MVCLGESVVPPVSTPPNLDTLDDLERGEQPLPEPASPIDAYCRGDTWATFRQTHGTAVYCDATV